MSFEEDESFLFGEETGGGEAPLATEEEVSSTSRVSESFPVEAFEISVELADLWNSAIEGKISIDEFKETLQALQSTIEVGRRRRRRRR